MENFKLVDFFYEISKIPRMSKDEKGISDYLLDFASNRGLEAVRDEYYNVIIKKPASIIIENQQPIILQCHTDMVYVTVDDTTIRYEDGISICEDDEYYFAKDSSLGADNGIGVAYCLAILDSQDIQHPDLEVVFTVQEEIGLVGAAHVDLSELKGKRLINMDSEEEGVFYSSCAGGIRCNTFWNLETEIVKDKIELEIKIRGMQGGHSGLFINQGRGNALVLLARIVYQLQQSLKSDDLRISHFEVKGKSNVIPSQGTVKVYIQQSEVNEAQKIIDKIFAEIHAELLNTDTFVGECNVATTQMESTVYTQALQHKMIRGILSFPVGVFGKSFTMKDLVETSMSIGAITESNNKIQMELSIRGSRSSQKYVLRDKVEVVAQMFCDSYEFMNDYPGWLYVEESELRDLAVETYEKLTGKKAIISAIHGGLECGYFAEKIQGLDIISIGPNLYDVHSTKEKISKASLEFTYEYLVMLIEQLAK